MKHPSEARLALHAGGDLGLWARWRTARHVARCERCRREVEAFFGVRDTAAERAGIPDVHWASLAAEMKANIRLGLAAGACVRAEPSRHPVASPLFAGARAAVAFASVLALLVTGLVLEHPAPRRASGYPEGVTVQATGSGIQVRGGGETLVLLHAREARDVTYSVGAQGSMRARYVDPDTGYVTVNNVYAQ